MTNLRPLLHTSGAVAERLRLPRWRLLYLIERGDLPSPSFQVPGRRLFTEDDIRGIEVVLHERPGLRGDDVTTDSHNPAT